jgi:hypothetical protein
MIWWRWIFNEPSISGSIDEPLMARAHQSSNVRCLAMVDDSDTWRGGVGGVARIKWMPPLASHDLLFCIKIRSHRDSRSAAFWVIGKVI